jgi:hypothetical protein
LAASKNIEIGGVGSWSPAGKEIIMKAISINGSPRQGGNTEVMLKKVLEPLEASGWSSP